MNLPSTYYVRLKPNYDANLLMIQKCQKEAFRHLSYLNQLKITLKDVKDTPPYLEIEDIYINTLKNFDILGNLFVEKSKEGCLENHCDDDYIFKYNDDFTLRKEYFNKKPEDVPVPLISLNPNITSTVNTSSTNKFHKKEINTFDNDNDYQLKSLTSLTSLIPKMSLKTPHKKQNLKLSFYYSRKHNHYRNYYHYNYCNHYNYSGYNHNKYSKFYKLKSNKIN